MNKHYRECIYLDFAATTPVDPQVVDTMLPYFNKSFGNPSSVHYYGQQAENALEDARSQIAGILECESKEIIFTSCGSESNNLALRGVAFKVREQNKSNHIIVSSVEHHAIIQTAKQLQAQHGFELEILPVDKFGTINTATLQARIRPDTAIVSIIYANNEIGTINSISELAKICQERGVIFHTDAVQAGTYLDLHTSFLNVDLLSLGAHKFYGPKGVGVLFIRSGTPVIPILTGGGQEFGFRAGTHNIPYIVGMAKALSLVSSDKTERNLKLEYLRNQIIENVLTNIPGSYLTGHPTNRLPNHASFVFENVNGNELLTMLDIQGFACSSGSACKTGSPTPSEVLLALGIPAELALGSLRITIGFNTTQQEIDIFLDALPTIIKRLRK